MNGFVADDAYSQKWLDAHCPGLLGSPAKPTVKQETESSGQLLAELELSYEREI